VHPEDTPVFEAKRARLWSGVVDQAAAQFRVRHKNGNYIWVLGRAGVVGRDQFGTPLRLVETRLDISEQKLLEQEFLQAQKMESIGRLAGGVAHDFNNHLTVINGYSRILKRQLSAEGRTAEMLQTVIEAGDRAAALTRQLLTFSRKEVERREAIQPDEIIGGLRRMLEHLIGEKVSLVIDPDPAAGWVMMDRTHLEQIVMNLVVNARDAICDPAAYGRRSIEAPGKINLATHHCVRNDQLLICLSVGDDGCGMAPDVRARIFEPFYTTKDRSHGTGLGLSTVWGIVERCGGFIEVESEPGSGSTFSVYIPAFHPTGSGDERPAPDETARGAGQTVLVIEDEEAVREFAVEALTHYGYQPLAAKSGIDAIALAGNETNIDAALIDLVMPGMNGQELAYNLVRLQPHVKILYASGYANDSIDREALMRSGAGFLPKPYNFEELARVIEELLASSPRQEV
jgi:signal transduction histidine kinase/CheY-like chemotaxis protein